MCFLGSYVRYSGKCIHGGPSTFTSVPLECLVRPTITTRLYLCMASVQLLEKPMRKNRRIEEVERTSA